MFKISLLLFTLLITSYFFRYGSFGRRWQSLLKHSRFRAHFPLRRYKPRIDCSLPRFKQRWDSTNFIIGFLKHWNWKFVTDLHQQTSLKRKSHKLHLPVQTLTFNSKIGNSINHPQHLVWTYQVWSFSQRIKKLHFWAFKLGCYLLCLPQSLKKITFPLFIRSLIFKFLFHLFVHYINPKSVRGQLCLHFLKWCWTLEG